MELIFRKLASINIWYDYFLPEGVVRESQIPENYSITEFFEIVPSNITAQKLSDYKIKILKTRFGIELYTQSKSIGGGVYEPLIIPDQNDFLAFEIVVKYPNILNSGVVQLGSQQAFALSNMKTQKLSVDDGNGGTEDVVYLNSEIESYVGAKTYDIENIVKKGSDYFLSLRASNNKPTSNTSYWRALGKVNGVTVLDSVDSVSAGVHTESGISVKGKKVSLQNRNEEILAELSVSESENDTAYFNLRDRELGVKQLLVDDVVESTWVNTNRKTLAVIELAIQGKPTELPAGVSKLAKEQMLIGNGTSGTINGEILNNKWVVRFLNKSTIWKYNFNKDQVFNNTDLATAGFEKLSDKEIQSKENIALTQKSVEVDAGLGILLPNPKQDSIKIIYDNNDKVEKYVSELYVNI